MFVVIDDDLIPSASVYRGNSSLCAADQFAQLSVGSRLTQGSHPTFHFGGVLEENGEKNIEEKITSFPKSQRR
jgi:hypothetical protein